MGRRIITILFLTLSASLSPVMAQMPIKLPVRDPSPPDSADLAYYGKKDFRQAALTVGGLNVAVWSFDRFVRNTEFSKISFKSVRENIRHGFYWDNDHLSTNMFMHPYHGNLYFNAARSNGFNYWQSGLFAFGGSAMWELVMENEYPSTNDIIATPIGGMALGEVTFRASDIMLNDRTTGWERFGREFAAMLISPTRGLTRIINGDAWRHRATTGRQFGVPNVALEISAGARWLQMSNYSVDAPFGATIGLNLEYGDRYELRSTTPYDYFNFRLDLSIQRTQPVISQVNITGRLISRELVDTRNHDLSVGMYQHYEFYDSDTISRVSDKTPYKLGIPASVGAGLLYRGTNIGEFTVDAYTHANAIILGGILTDHYMLKDRNYNLASGFSVKSGVNLVFRNDKFSFSGSYDYYRLYTWGYPRNTDLRTVDPRTFNAEGDASVAFFGVCEARADVRLTRHVYLSGSFAHYLRSTRYRDFPDVRSSSFESRLMLTYKF